MAPRSPFRFILNRDPPPELIARLCGARLQETNEWTPAEIPGAYASRNGRVLLAQLNCAWILERELQKAGVAFRVEPPKESPRARWADVVEKTRGELREWVPNALFDFQKKGVLFALRAPEESAAMHMPTGAGKSLVGVVWACYEPGPCIFVTKAAARRTIQREFQRYTTIEPIVLIPKAERRKKDPDPEAQIAVLLDAGAVPRVVIVGWETIPTFLPTLLSIPYVSLVLDEIHKVSNHRRYAKVAQAAETGSERPEFRRLDNIVSCTARLAANARRRLGLTATPIPDRRRNLWSQLDMIHPGAWGKAWDFFWRFCDVKQTNHGNLDNSGKSNTEELDRRLSFVRYKVDSSETRRELPPCRRQVLYIPKSQQSPPSAFARELERAKKIGRRAIVEVKLAEAASRKRGVLVEHVKDALAGAGASKVIIFTGRHADCERLDDAIGKALPGVQRWMAHGGHGAARRDEIRDAFMGRPEDKERGLPEIPPHPGPCVLVGTGASWGECFTPDAFVLGENKPIGDYTCGDRVVGVSGLGTCRGVKAKTFDGDMIEVRAQGLLPFMATPNHVIRTLAGGITAGQDRHFISRGVDWKFLESVEPWDPSPRYPKDAHGDFVLVPRVPGKYTAVTFDLNKFVARDRDIPARTARGAPQYLTLDKDFAWVLGLYAAEGSAASRGDGQGWRAYFSLGGHERGVAERVREILFARGLAATLNPLPKVNALNVTVRSGPFARLMQVLMGSGAHNKRIPDEVLFNTDIEVTRAFVQGYALGDGATDGNKVQTSTVSKTLALQIQLAVARLGRFAGITPWKTKESSIRGRPVHSSSFYIMTWRWQDLRHKRYKVYNDFIAVPVKSVRKVAYSGTVVDIGTTDRTFLASNAVVHNSYNLQDCDLLIMAQLPINAKELWQQEGRVSRHGQKRPVLILYPVAEGTIDEHVKSILLDKLPDVADLQKDSNFIDAVNDLASSGLTDEQITDSLLDKILGGSEQE